MTSLIDCNCSFGSCIIIVIKSDYIQTLLFISFLDDIYSSTAIIIHIPCPGSFLRLDNDVLAVNSIHGFSPPESLPISASPRCL